MVKVKLPDIRKNKLSVIIKSLEKRDAAMQRFQRRDLYNAKSVKIVENTQIELYLPTLCNDKGKPTWNNSTHLGRSEKNGHDKHGHGHGNASAPGSKALEEEGGNGLNMKNKGSHGKKDGKVLGRKFPHKSPVLEAGLNTLRTTQEDAGQVSTSGTSHHHTHGHGRTKDKDGMQLGTFAHKVEMVFKPNQSIVQTKEGQKFSTSKTNMLSLKSWNQNNPTENACHWLSSGPREDLEHVQVFKGSILKKHPHLNVHSQSNNSPSSSSGGGGGDGVHTNFANNSMGMNMGEKYAVSMVKPNLPQVSTSPPRGSQHLIEQFLHQQERHGHGDDDEDGLNLSRMGSFESSGLGNGSMMGSDSLSPTRSRSRSESLSPTRNDVLGAGVNQFPHHTSYHHSEFSSFRDNSHIQGNISQHHARNMVGKGGQSFIEASFVVKNVSKDGTIKENSLIHDGNSGLSSSPGKQQLKIYGMRQQRQRSPILTKSAHASPQHQPACPPLPPVDPLSSSPGKTATIGTDEGTDSTQGMGIFMPYRYQQVSSVENVDDDGTGAGTGEGSVAGRGSIRTSNVDTSQVDLMNSVLWLSTKSAIAQATRKGQSKRRTPPQLRKPTPSPQTILTSSSSTSGHAVGTNGNGNDKGKIKPQVIVVSPSKQRADNNSRSTMRHGMIPERTAKAVLYPLQLSAKVPPFRERSIKGLSIATSKKRSKK